MINTHLKKQTRFILNKHYLYTFMSFCQESLNAKNIIIEKKNLREGRQTLKAGTEVGRVVNQPL